MGDSRLANLGETMAAIGAYVVVMELAGIDNTVGSGVFVACVGVALMVGAVLRGRR